MITFDPQTYLDWNEKAITRVSIEFISSGCEGTSIKIHEDIILDWYIPFDIHNSSVTLYADATYQETIENAYITNIRSNWILKSESIITRCGCWKSFGIKSGDLKIDNIRILKSKLSKNKWNHH